MLNIRSWSLLLLVMGVFMACVANEPEVDILTTVSKMVDAGDFTVARETISEALASDLSDDLRRKLEFEDIRMDRILDDFVASEAEVLEFIKEYVPEVTPEDLARWESSRALEVMVIDGEKRYFRWAARNLFRIDADMREVWQKAHPSKEITSGSGATSDLDRHNQRVINAALETGERWVEPTRFRITQSVEVPAGTIPAGETLRCWIPFPREIEGRQVDIRIEGTTPTEHVLASADALQRTIYFEQEAAAETAALFSVTYTYVSHGTYIPVTAESVQPLEDPEALAPYLSEFPPHIVFTPELRALSESILEGETNPYLKARKLFAWIDGNIPWASAREYSTIRCIPEYARINGHGDCGIQGLLFITLCRMNGIPARWQSGWEFQPPNDSMHDWGMIYFEPFGWMPMDVTYGLRDTDEEQLKWFYLSGMDSYRLVYNDAFSQPFFPAKTHPRSETVDSQRGEVEWDGGNLYFNQWNWNHEWEILTDS